MLSHLGSKKSPLWGPWCPHKKKTPTCNNRTPVQLAAGQRLASEAMLLGQDRAIEEVI